MTDSYSRGQGALHINIKRNRIITRIILINLVTRRSEVYWFVCGGSDTMSVSNANIQAQLTPSTRLPKIKEDQERVLQSNFSSNRNPTDLDLTLIAAEAGLSEEDVKLWYQHRLACWRQQQGLPANSRSIMDWWRHHATMPEFVRCFLEFTVFEDFFKH